MNRIILIETSTALCSTALVQDGVIVSERKSDESRAHASKTALFVSEMLQEQGLKVSDCSAVAVSKGPGSYTGLRVGASTAKGLCFGSGLPLIGVSTLETLVWQALDWNMLPEGCRHIVPMIDARRMEVYTATFSPEGVQTTPTVAQIVDGETFKTLLEDGPVLFIGDGAEKCRDTINNSNAVFVQCCPVASSMMHPAIKAVEKNEYEDMAYFEPFYLKEFVTTVSKKKIL